MRRILRASSALPLGVIAGNLVKHDFSRCLEKKQCDSNSNGSLFMNIKLQLPKVYAQLFELSCGVNDKANELEKKTGIGDEYLSKYKKRYIFLEFPGYYIYYDTWRHNPGVTYEYLSRHTDEVPSKKYFWRSDDRLKDAGKIYLTRPPYDKARMASPENHKKSDVDHFSTHFISNASPQHVKLNKGTWSLLEQYTRDKLLYDSTEGVHVFTGPAWTNFYKGRVKNTKVDIPSHFFKVIITEKKGGAYRMECFIVPNESDEDNKDKDVVYPEALFDYLTNLEVIDKLTGLKLGKKRKSSAPLTERKGHYLDEPSGKKYLFS